MTDPQALVRPMTGADVLVAQEIKTAAFADVDERTTARHLPVRVRSTPGPDSEWAERVRHLLVTDPGGCWVAEVDGEVVGLAVSLVRETLWILATYAVRPGLQGQGIGRHLLDAARRHGRGCVRGIFSASDDPLAAHRYLRAGFELHPQMVLSGVVDRDAVPAVRHVREATHGDLDLMDSVDRHCRGAGHGADHAHLRRHFRALVVDHPTGAGYAFVSHTPDGTRVELLAATNRRTAERLLWAALGEAAGPVTIAHVTGANNWAVRVGDTAGLSLHTSGYLAVSGLRPPTTYLHHGALL